MILNYVSNDDDDRMPDLNNSFWEYNKHRWRTYIKNEMIEPKPFSNIPRKEDKYSIQLMAQFASQALVMPSNEMTKIDPSHLS